MSKYQDLNDIFKYIILKYIEIKEIIFLCSTNTHFTDIYNDFETWKYLIKRDFDMVIENLYSNLETYKKYYNYKIIHNNIKSIFIYYRIDKISYMNIFDKYIYNDYSPIYIIIPAHKYNTKKYSYSHILTEYNLHNNLEDENNLQDENNSQEKSGGYENNLQENSEGYEDYSHIFSIYEYQLEFYNNILNVVQEYDFSNYTNNIDEKYNDKIYSIREKYDKLILYLKNNNYNWKLSEGDIYKEHKIIDNTRNIVPYDDNIIIRANSISDPIFKILNECEIVNIKIQDTLENIFYYDSSIDINEKSLNYYRDIIKAILYLKTEIQYIPVKSVLKAITKIQTDIERINI